jgi:hypothetical protein
MLASGCGITDFDVDQSVPEQMIQGSALPGPLATLFPIPLSLDISQAIAAKDTGPIGGVYLSKLVLTITAADEPSGDTDDWSFVDSIEVFVNSSKSGSTLPRVQIASVTSPGAVQTLKMTPDDSVNLKPYIDEGSTVESEGSGTAPPDDVSFDGTSTFTVHPL